MQDGEVPEVVVVKDVGAKNLVVTRIAVVVAVEIADVVLVVTASMPTLQMQSDKSSSGIPQVKVLPRLLLKTMALPCCPREAVITYLHPRVIP